MKTFYLTWNRDNVEDETILKDIKRISNDKIDISLAEIEEEDLLELDAKERKRSKQLKSAHAKQSSEKNHRKKGRSSSSSQSSSSLKKPRRRRRR